MENIKVDKSYIGREIIIYDGSDIKDYGGVWAHGIMDHLIGGIYEIISVNDCFNAFNIKDEKGESWLIDPRGCDFVDTDDSVGLTITENLSVLF